MQLTNFRYRKILILIMNHIIRRKFIHSYFIKDITKGISLSINLNINMILPIKILKN